MIFMSVWKIETKMWKMICTWNRIRNLTYFRMYFKLFVLYVMYNKYPNCSVTYAHTCQHPPHAMNRQWHKNISPNVEETWNNNQLKKLTLGVITTGLPRSSHNTRAWLGPHWSISRSSSSGIITSSASDKAGSTSGVFTPKRNSSADESWLANSSHCRSLLLVWQ